MAPCLGKCIFIDRPPLGKMHRPRGVYMDKYGNLLINPNRRNIILTSHTKQNIWQKIVFLGLVGVHLLAIFLKVFHIQGCIIYQWKGN